MFNKLKDKIIILFILLSIFPSTLFAYSNKIIAGGESVGIELSTKGVLIVGFYDILGDNPGKDAGLYKGDVITKAGNNNVESIDDFVDSIKNNSDLNLDITYLRGNKEKNTTLNLVKDDGIIKTGLYVKDSITGIGTLSFIDPNTHLYGALGHEIIESTSGVKIDVKEGKIYSSKITSIEKSERGDPGSKKAVTNSEDIYGNIIENTSSGIFGTYTKEFNTNDLYNVSNYKDIKLGKAKILTVTDGNKKTEYEINIISINNNNDNKNILFEITDNKLLEKTGGIVQGMSGSPIIQGNNIIGAVTNVVVNNPKKGYGILITSMLKEAEN